MTYKLFQNNPFKAVLTTFLCFVLILGLASQNHATQLFTDDHFTSSENLIVEQLNQEASEISNIAFQTVNENTNLLCDKQDCFKYSFLDDSACVDDCCNSICHSFLLTSVFALPKYKPGNHTLRKAKNLTDRSVAPALSPPRV